MSSRRAQGPTSIAEAAHASAGAAVHAAVLDPALLELARAIGRQMARTELARIGAQGQLEATHGEREELN